MKIIGVEIRIFFSSFFEGLIEVVCEIKVEEDLW